MGVVVLGPVDSRLAEVVGEDRRKRSLSVRDLAHRRRRCGRGKWLQLRSLVGYWEEIGMVSAALAAPGVSNSL